MSIPLQIILVLFGLAYAVLCTFAIIMAVRTWKAEQRAKAEEAKEKAARAELEARAAAYVNRLYAPPPPASHPRPASRPAPRPSARPPHRWTPGTMPEIDSYPSAHLIVDSNSSTISPADSPSDCSNSDSSSGSCE